MKKLVAVLLCLALLPALICNAEEISGRRTLLDNIVVTIGEEDFDTGLSAVLEQAATADGELFSFHLDYQGEHLLPFQAKRSPDGLSVMLGDSNVYCFAPEWFAWLTGQDTSTAAKLLGSKAQSLPELAFGFAEFLDAQPADEFLLDAPLLTDWLAAEFEVDKDAQSAVSNLHLPEITIVRETTQYSISVSGEMPMRFSLTHDDRLISLKNSDTDFRIGLQVYRDGNIQASFLTSESYINRTDKNLLIKYSHTPNADGSAKFSMTLDYDDTWMYYDWGRTLLYAEGNISPEGNLDGKIRISDDGQLLNLFVPAAIQLHLSADNAGIENRMTGKPVQILYDYRNPNQALNLLGYSAMDLMDDIEKLISDPQIQKIAAAHNALFFETYGEEYSAAFPD